jgi:dTDP-4-amino-4,6-dideoxygalactose transaminase
LLGLDGLQLSERAAQASSALYTVRVAHGKRDALRAYLLERGVETAVHYPIPLSRQSALLERGEGLPEGSLPETERAAREVLSLPLYPELSREQLEHVVASVRAFFTER